MTTGAKKTPQQPPRPRSKNREKESAFDEHQSENMYTCLIFFQPNPDAHSTD